MNETNFFKQENIVPNQEIDFELKRKFEEWKSELREKLKENPNLMTQIEKNDLEKINFNTLDKENREAFCKVVIDKKDLTQEEEEALFRYLGGDTDPSILSARHLISHKLYNNVQW